MSRNLKVAVLMGGIGGERGVSLKSGKAVCEALRAGGHEVFPFDVTDTTLSGLDRLPCGVAFVALHGAFGEDGGVQALLERMRIPYTGSGPQASRLGMDKVESKRRFVRWSVPSPDYFVVEDEDQFEQAQAAAQHMGFPLVCKPADSGSSLGITVAKGPRQLSRALAEALSCGSKVLLERYVRGREFTVGVLDGEPLPVVEVRPRRAFFDFHAKYEDQGTEYITPIALIPSVYRKVLKAGMRAYESIRCRHFARVDMLYGYDGRLNVLEVNTIPGLTPRSLLPMAAKEAGIDFVELCDRIVQMAAQDGLLSSSRKKVG